MDRISTNRNAKLNLQQRIRHQITSRLKAITTLCHSEILNGGDDILKDVNHQLVDIESRLNESVKPLLRTRTEDLPMA